MSRQVLRYGQLSLLVVITLAFSVCQSQNSIETLISDPVTSKSYHAYNESFALIVGIDHYVSVEPRTSAVAAARTLKDLLESRFGFREGNIIMLLDDQARRDVILDGLKKMRRRGPDDRLLIFFSGRGYTAGDQAGNQYGFFVPVDGRTDSADHALATCVSLDDLKESVASNSAKQTLVLLDFMVGGLRVEKQFSGPPPPRVGFENVVMQPSKELFAAGARVEPLIDDPRTGMSFFSSKLIEALSSNITDLNSDGIITGTELAAQTSLKVTEVTGWKMHPQFGFMDGGKGDFIFVMPSATDTSRISFSIMPNNAAVFIDDKQVEWQKGGIPVISPRAGVHTFQVQREGYRAVKNEFFVNGRVSLKADVALEKIPSRGLLVKVSQPDARVTIDGKFVGAPDRSLIVDPIEKGTHLVRADLEGYFSDSMRVDVEEPIQYTANLVLTSRNGFISIRSSEAVHITLDGKDGGMQQLVRKEVLPGPHTFILSGIGYDTYERKIIVHDSESVVIDHPLYRPTLTGALIRSAVFPGWGQSYSGRHGIVYSVLFLGCVGGTVEAQLMYTKANSDYKKNLAAYNAAQSPADAANLLPSVKSSRTKRNNFNYLRIAAGGVTGAFYLYNIINVWTNNPAELIRQKEEEARKEHQRVSIVVGVNELGPSISLSAQF